MPRTMLVGLALALALGGIGRAGEDEGEDPEAEFAPGIRLIRLDTLGDMPPPENRLVVNVDAEGRILVAGEAVTHDELKAIVVRRADVSREDGMARASRLDLVLRIDRSVPWCAVLWIMSLGADPDARVWKYHFVVRPGRGETEGTFSVALPKDRGLEATPDPSSVPPARLPIRVRATGDGSEPGLLGETIRSVRFPTNEVFPEVRADRLAPTGYVLRVLDRVVASGLKEITLVYATIERSPTGGSFEAYVREAKKTGGKPSIECYGRVLGRGEFEHDTVARIRKGFAARLSRFSSYLPDMDEAPTVPALPFRTRIWRSELKAYGGEGTRSAVLRGLRWLAYHQGRDGRWGAADFDENCSVGKCGAPGDAAFDTIVTGLALLAFLGMDQTAHGTGRYGYTMGRGLAWLRAAQDDEGCFGPRKGAFATAHAIATLAMAEAYALTGSPACRKSAQAGVDFIDRCRKPGLAWSGGIRCEHDVEVTAWMVSALYMAKSAGLKVPEEAFAGARAMLGKGVASDPMQSLAAAEIWSRILLGEDPVNSPAIRKGAVLSLGPLPRHESALIDPHDCLFRSLALFQYGGKPWEQGNRMIKTALVRSQSKDGAAAGSWKPVGPWAERTGRVASTAVAVLTLQTYYRYARGLGRER